MVLLASGTGFAPIKALIEQLQFKGVTRPATLYWGGRRPPDLYMDEWVKARVAEMPNLTADCDLELIVPRFGSLSIGQTGILLAGSHFNDGKHGEACLAKNAAE